MSAPPKNSFCRVKLGTAYSVGVTPTRQPARRRRNFLPRYLLSALFFYPALVRAGDAHVFAVFGYGAAGHLNALRLQDAGDLLVGQRAAGIFFFDEFLDAAFEDEQRCAAALGPLDALAEEVSQLEYALRCMRVFVGHSTAYRGRMHADFFGHLLDHHGFQLIDASFEEILLAGNDAITNFGDGLLALLDVLDELDGAFVALFDVVARTFFVGAVAGNQFLVGRIEAKLDFVVAQAGTRVERADVVQRCLNGFDGTPTRLGYFFVLLIL